MTGRSMRLAAGQSFESYIVELGLVSEARIGELIRRARRERVSLLTHLLAEGVVSEDRLYGALAAFHDLRFIAEEGGDLVPTVDPAEAGSCLTGRWIELASPDCRRTVAAAPDDSTVTTMRHIPGDHGRSGLFDAVTTPGAIRYWIERYYGNRLVDDAVLSLAEERPELSAYRRLTPGQMMAVGGVLGAAAAGLALAPAIAAGVLFATLALVLAHVALLWLIVFGSELGREPRPVRPPAEDDGALPVYTVLVPLYGEPHMAERIVDALSRLDYPRSKLDVKLILEADDEPTVAAVAGFALPPWFEILRVPPALPRTRGKALAYALAYARGALVAVYDAEDEPDPGQLRQAVAAFARADGRTAALQARHVVDNGEDGWLSRQAAIECAGLFGVLAPALARVEMPLMLAGSSSHFRTDVLRRIGGFDPFNVTENADLGVRLARLGYRCGPLDSATAKEAPASLDNWIAQRTRRTRGLMQTWFVHMREPRRLLSELGWSRFLAAQIILGGSILAALAHPLFAAYLVGAAMAALAGPAGASGTDTPFMALSAVSLIACYGAMIEVGVLGLYRAGQARFFAHLALVPAYWMLMSIAAYGAVWRFIVRPFGWQRTRHRRRAS